MRAALIGAGAISRLALTHARSDGLDGAEIVAVLARPGSERAARLAADFRIPVCHSLQGLLEYKPDVVVEAASHAAVREYGVAVLDAGVSLIVLSGGALADDALRASLEAAAKAGGATLNVPSGGIGALDVLKTACIAGVDSVTICVMKPPQAWKGIEAVEAMKIDLDALTAPAVLFDGTAREGVPLFPQNVNIAAVLSLAGIGFDRTRLRVVADPTLKFNTHQIDVSGKTGRFSLRLENVPTPENPKTAWLACFSALAALKSAANPIRYGT
jgi:aspartate dehydrogenase